MTKILDEETELTHEGNGRYVRTLTKGPFWGVVTPHGGYLMALALQAMTLEVGDAARKPRMLSQHFLGSLKPGPVAVDVTVERVGRGVTSVSARISGGDRLVGLATALFTTEGEGPAFLDDPMPEVAMPDQPDTEMLGFFVANVHHTYDFHRRFGTGGTALPCEDGGWIVSKTPGAWDARDALVASDIWVPPIIRHPDRVCATPSLHHVAHFGPDVTGSEAVPFLVHHQLTNGGAGLTDESIRLWAEDGRMLLSARQLRTVVSPEKALGREMDENALDEAEKTYEQIRTD
ncbi:MAG: hypothetical protein CL931_10070 [Deltaproteobacteria bacterium]|nr:hypothetical protein [Deltaproteobacteria bacterium]